MRYGTPDEENPEWTLEALCSAKRGADVFCTYQPIPGVTVIAFGHKSRQGKDHAAAVLQRTFPTRCRRYAFGDVIRRCCEHEYGMTEKDPGLMQRVGMWGRATDPQRWIRPIYLEIANAMPEVAILTDLRMTSEVAFVKALGGFTVDVRRYTNGWERYVSTDRDTQHVSEVELDDYEFDFVLRNHPESKPSYFDADVIDLFTQLVPCK